MKNIENRILITNLDAITLLSIGSPENYEKIIEEWAKSYLKEKCGKYMRVEKLGGAGDKGRDIVCTINDKSDEWDNYQCKHYHKPISPSMVWVEFAKLIYYVFIGDYSCPVNYYFVSPLGVGTKFRDLLKAPDEIKKGLIANWDKYCKEKVTSLKIIELNDTLISFIDNFDFSIFDYISPSDFIDQFKLTPYYTQRFGRLYKPRPLTECPDEIEPFEMEYIKKILQAYSDYLNEHVDKNEQLNKHPKLKEHFKRQRYNFFEAQALKEFSREIHNPDFKYFEKFMNEVYTGIINEIDDDAENGFKRLNNVLKRAEQMQITNNPLTEDVTINDRHGMCHHLANEKDDIKWI